MNAQAKIVEDGRRRAYDGTAEEIRDEIEAKYADEMRKAGRLRRIVLWCRIRWEIHQRAKRKAPDDGLYSREGRRG